MKYHCYACDWTGHHDEVTWADQWVNSEAWGVVKNQKSQYAVCPECDSDDVGEVEDKDRDEPVDDEPNELSMVILDIARMGAV